MRRGCVTTSGSMRDGAQLATPRLAALLIIGSKIMTHLSSLSKNTPTRRGSSVNPLLKPLFPMLPPPRHVVARRQLLAISLRGYLEALSDRLRNHLLDKRRPRLFTLKCEGNLQSNYTFILSSQRVISTLFSVLGACIACPPCHMTQLY